MIHPVFCQITHIGQLQSSSSGWSDDTLTVERRSWRTFDIELFSADLQTTVANILSLPPTSVDDLFDCYNQELSALLDKHVPVSMARPRHRHYAPWFNADCRHAKSIMHHLEKRFRRLRTPASYAEWQQQSDHVRDVYQEAFRLFWTEKLADTKGDGRATWAAANKLLQPSTPAYSSLPFQT